MNKKISARLFFAVMWRGICQAFRSVGKLFGRTDSTGYGKVIWRISYTCLSLLLLFFTVFLFAAFFYGVVYEKWIRPHTSDRIWDEVNISNHIVTQNMYYSNDSRVYDKLRQKVLIEDVDWVVVSDDKDSLAVFAKDGRRGYLNRFTGEVTIPLQYSRAWVFSEGLAAVEKDGELLFIDHSGQVVIDKDLQVYPDGMGYAFRNGYCIVRDPITGKLGLIDRNGDWALETKYDNLFCNEGFWQVEKDGCVGLYTSEMESMFPIDNSYISISDSIIEVRHADHIARRYDFDGNVVVDFVIDDIMNLRYETDKLRSDIVEYADTEGDATVYGIANRQVYKVGSGLYTDYYGLIGRDGRRITPPLYTSIKAVGKDRYLCQPQGVVIDDYGNIVE